MPQTQSCKPPMQLWDGSRVVPPYLIPFHKISTTPYRRQKTKVQSKPRPAMPLHATHKLEQNLNNILGLWNNHPDPNSILPGHTPYSGPRYPTSRSIHEPIQTSNNPTHHHQYHTTPSQHQNSNIIPIPRRMGIFT